MILEKIQSPADVKKLNKKECGILCEELREFLVSSVSKTGGHLASNLGVVELTLAIHRVFDTEKDRKQRAKALCFSVPKKYFRPAVQVFRT